MPHHPCFALHARAPPFLLHPFLPSPLPSLAKGRTKSRVVPLPLTAPSRHLLFPYSASFFFVLFPFMIVWFRFATVGIRFAIDRFRFVAIWFRFVNVWFRFDCDGAGTENCFVSTNVRPRVLRHIVLAQFARLVAVCVLVCVEANGFAWLCVSLVPFMYLI